MHENRLTLNRLFAGEPGGERAFEDFEKEPTLRLAVRSLPSIAQDAICHEIVLRLREMMDIDIHDIATTAWSKCRELAQYADRTRYPADATILVPLAEHQIRSVHEPRVQILFNGQAVAQVAVEIVLELQIEGALLKVQDGRIRGIEAGRGRARASVKCIDTKLFERQSEYFNLPGAGDLGAGIPILRM